jgi:serine/threonine protein kinase
MTDESPPRKTKLYGGIDLPEHYPPTISDAVGTQVDGSAVGEVLDRYHIGDMLGRGGMGEVLSARDEQIGRAVAIKRLRVANPPPDVVARFLREARIQSRLEHPAVVPVHELVTIGEQPFFVMKQLAGITLADVIAKLAQRDPRTIEEFPRLRLLRAFADVCLAVEFAHTRGVVHRDLKPANVIVGDFGEVYILDWGIARVLHDPEGDRPSFADVHTLDGTQTVVGSILGTPGYISPEQISNDDSLDGRADVYALGCILYEILTLQPLLPRGSAAVASRSLASMLARPCAHPIARSRPSSTGSAPTRPSARHATASRPRVRSETQSCASSTATATSRCARSWHAASSLQHVRR